MLGASVFLQFRVVRPCEMELASILDWTRDTQRIFPPKYIENSF